MSKYHIPKLSTIEVDSLRLRAYVGFMDWEREKLQDLIISYSFKYDSSNATAIDDVSEAVDYKHITKEIISMVDSHSFDLIETIADKVYYAIEEYSSLIQEIEVKIEKPHALRFADSVFVKVSSKDRYNKVMIALGSNIDRDENFEMALLMLQRLGLIVNRTEFIVTKPLKYERQNDFLNGAILLITHHSLSQLEMELKQVEAMLGRVRGHNKNAARVIDLDIITFNGVLVDKDIGELPFIMDFIGTLQPDIDIKSK